MKLSYILLALFLLVGTAAATPADWPYLQDPMAVDTYDTLDNPGNGGTYTIGDDGVDIPVTVTSSNEYMEPINLQIMDSDLNILAEKDLGFDANGQIIEETMHLYPDTNPGMYNIALNGIITDSITLVAEETDDDNDNPNGGGIPEFPSIALPMAAIIGLAFIFRKRE